MLKDKYIGAYIHYRVRGNYGDVIDHCRMDRACELFLHLYDINATPIYVTDILQDEAGRYFRVVFHAGSARYCKWARSSRKKVLTPKVIFKKKMRVVGDIYKDMHLVQRELTGPLDEWRLS